MMWWIGSGNGWSTGGWWAMGFMMVFWIVVIGLGIWAIVRFTSGTTSSTTVSTESARAILDRRFANGEIDATAYAEARRVLEIPGSDKGA